MKFRIFIQGENFLLSLEGSAPKKYGFYVTAHIDATTAKEAEAQAFSLIRDYKELRALVRNSPDDRPKLLIEEIESIVDWPDDVTRPLTGLTYYEEETA